eukprot:GFKZ01012716.1.p1 GENE.GFKZ01012716.1~~GFKZ01012716.1.p1  ORF type:complete len:184 (-),score=32.23 GFKZ01012716.1:198-749(-)
MPGSGKTENENGPEIVVVAEPKEAVECPTAMTAIVVRDAKAALDWYEKAMGATVTYRYDTKDGRVMHAMIETSYGLQVSLEDHDSSMHMVRPVLEGEEIAGEGCATKGSTYVYVTIPEGKGSADECVERMREAGGTVIKEAKDMFYGYRLGQVVDVYGVAWAFAHKIEMKNGDAGGAGVKEGE